MPIKLTKINLKNWLKLKRCLSSISLTPPWEQLPAINSGDKISLYTFLLAGGIIKDAAVKEFEVCIEVPRQSVIPLLVILKHHSLFNCDFLVDIAVWDKPGERFRFSILYMLLSVPLNLRLSVLCQTREGVPLESVIDLYESASWSERECWDMYGVYFINHNNFLRLLTDYGFRGHPLRKDFPLSGFVELFYDDYTSGVLYEPVELMQEYRNFQFKSPWAEEPAEAEGESEEESFDFDSVEEWNDIIDDPDFNGDFDFESSKAEGNTWSADDQIIRK